MELEKNGTFQGMRYLVRFPEAYIPGRTYPAILFLHGAGSRGMDIRLLSDNPFFRITQGHNAFPFVVIAPQCGADTWFDVFETLKRFAASIADEDYVDRERIYLMGSSMGGYAVWQLAMSMPQLFAAIVPICGGGMYWNAGRLKDVPVWAFHGEKDCVVLPEESAKMVDAVTKYGGSAMLTLYPENGHDAWSDTYRNPKLYEWLLSFRNRHTAGIPSELLNSQAYG